MERKLTEKQIAWAKLYATGNYTKYAAALEAGYSRGAAANSGTNNAQDPLIMDLVAKYRQAKDDLDTIDTAWVVRELVDTYRKAKQMNQNAAAGNLLAQLGKYTGGFTGEEKAATINYLQILGGLSTDEIKQLAQLSLPSEAPVKVDTPMEVIDLDGTN